MSQITQVSKLYTFLNNTYIPQFVKFRGNTIYMKFVLKSNRIRFVGKGGGRKNRKLKRRKNRRNMRRKRRMSKLEEGKVGWR